MNRKTAFIVWVGALIGIMFLVSWASVLSSANPVTHPLATIFPWPVACTTRGCVASTAWAKLYNIQTKFAHALSEQPATPAQTLTTLVRQHVTRSATLRSPVTLQDAEKYRQEILKLTDEGHIQELTGLSISEYDKKIVLPFLQQEALRQQMKVESIDELYIQLSKDRWITVLPNNMWWDYDKGSGIRESNP